MSSTVTVSLVSAGASELEQQNITNDIKQLIIPHLQCMSPLIDHWSTAIDNSHWACPDFKVFFICTESKQTETEPCLMVLRLKVTVESRKLLYSKMAKPPSVHKCGLDTFLPKRATSNAQRLDQKSS